MSIPSVNADLIPCGDEAAWLSERCKRVQASDAAKILADDQSYAVYADKVAPVLFANRDERFDIKLAMEAPVRNLYQRKYGGRVHAWPAYTIAVSKEYPWLGCTPDSLVEDPSRHGVGNHQIKCWSEFEKAKWLADGPPLYVQVQTQIEMLVIGCTWGVIAVMFGSQSLERFYVEPNEAFLSAALPILRDFYTCLELRTPPPVDGSAASTKALARLHPNDNGMAVHLPEDSDAWLARLRRVKSLAKRCEERKAAIENQIRAAIGDNTFGVTPSGEWLSWKSQTRKSYTVSESTSRVLRECRAPHQVEFADGSGVTGIDYKVAERVQLPAWIKTKLLNANPRCRWCGCQLTRHSATIEHLTPLSLGGTNDITNLDLACALCNQKRGSNATLPVSTAGRA